METAMEIALRKAQQEAAQRHGDVAANLRKTVGEWAADDNVHKDPPLPTIKENETMHTASNQPTQPNGNVPSGAAQAPVGMSMTETIFHFIRENPGIIRKAAVDQLSARHGFKQGSVSSLIGQMVLQRHVHQDDDNRLQVMIPKFKPLASGKVREAFVEARRLELMRTNPRKAMNIDKIRQGRKARSQQQPPAAEQPKAEIKPKPKRERLQGDALERQKIESLLKARASMAAKRMDPRFVTYMSEKMKAWRARQRGENYPEPVMPQINTNTVTFKRRYEEALQREREKMRKQGKFKIAKTQGEDKMAGTTKTLNAVREARAKTNGIDIDAAHKAARSWPGPNTSPDVQEVIRQHAGGATPDLRSMTADQIVEAMSLTQALAVFAKLKEHLQK